MQAPIKRSRLRYQLARQYYILKRKWTWISDGKKYARQTSSPLPIALIEHSSPLFRRLKDVDMYLQHNKVTNLTIAASKINLLVIQPGETFSFWRMVGDPTASRGFLPGLILQQGKIGVGVGGGLCQMGNLLYWMALHTPLTVTERWRHSYDVFPDAERTLPFGSGATLAWNYIDLQLKNNTTQPFQIQLWLSDQSLHGNILTTEPWPIHYEVFESEHRIHHEPWGGYSRHNTIARHLKKDNEILETEMVTENHALMMYQPFIAMPKSKS